MLVVIAILASLLMLLFPAVMRALDRGHATRCNANLRQIGIAQFVYSTEHHGRFTRTWQTGSQERTWQERLAPYIATAIRTDPANVLSCPLREPSPEGANLASYAMNVFTTWPEWDFRVEAVPVPGNTILLGDCIESNSDIMYYADRDQTWGVPGFRHARETVANMLFCDGSARGMTKEELMLNSGRWRWW